MSQNLDVGIRITADGRVLVTEVKAAQAALNQIGETAKRTNTESAAAAERFTANLKRQADTLGMTASQVRAYDAAQLKLNEAQRASVEASNRAITAFEKQQAAAKSNTDILGSLKANLVATAAAYVSYAAVMAGGKAVVDTALANERLNNTLKVGVGTTEAAAKETAFLRQESERLGLHFATVADQYGKLTVSAKGTRMEGQLTREVFLAVAQASSVLRISSEQTGRAFVAIQQMMNKGKVSAEEFTGQLSEALPGALQAAARGMNVTERELLDLMATGKLATDVLLPALTSGLNGTFGAQAQEAAQGLQAKINRLDNAFVDLKTAIGNTGLLDLLSEGIVLATRFTNALSGAKVLSAVEQQTQKIAAMRDELASLNNRKHFPLIGDLIFDKRQADLLEQRIEDGVADLAKLEKAAIEASEAMTGKKAITPGAKPALPDELVKEREKAAKAAESAAKKAADAKAREAKQALEDSAKIITALKRETQEVGLNAIQKRMLAAATEAAKAPTEALRQEIMASAAAWAQATQKQEESLALQKTQKEAAIERARSEKEAARQVQQEWRNTWGQVEQNAKMAFIQFAAHGKSAMQSIGEAIKFSIIDVLYQLTVRKWIINIGTSLESMVTSGSSSGSGGALNALFSGGNLLNAGKTIFNGFSSSLTSGAGNLLQSAGRMIGSNALSTFGSGMLGMGATGASTAAFSAVGGAGTAFIGGAGTAIGGTGMGAAASMGSMLSAAAGPAMIAFAVTQGLKMLAGDKRLGGGFGNVMNKIGDIPILGDLMPVIPLINALFGRGPLKQKETSLTGAIGLDGFESGMLQTRFQAKGGLFRSNKTDFARVDAVSGDIWTDNQKQLGEFTQNLSKAAKEIFNVFNDTARQTSTTLKQVGADLGLSNQALDGFQYQLNLVSEKGKGLADEQISKEIENMTDAMARKLLPQVDNLAKRSETALQTVTRLGAEFTSLVDAATLLGNSVADSKSFMSGTTFAGRTAFVDAAGGTDALMQNAQFFAENFLTDAERLAPAQERLNTELNRLGLSTDLTKEQFGDLVKSFGHVNGISAETLQALLDLAPAFLTVTNAAQQAAKDSQAIAQQAAKDAEAIAKQQKEAAGEARAAEKSARREAQQNVIDIREQRKQRSIQADIDDAEKRAQRERDLLKLRFDGEQKLLDEAERKSGVITSFIDSLGKSAISTAPLSFDDSRNILSGAIGKIRSGADFESIINQRLQAAASGAQNADERLFSSYDDFSRARGQAASQLNELAALGENQLSVENLTLNELKTQSELLRSTYEVLSRRIDSGLEFDKGLAQSDSFAGITSAQGTAKRIAENKAKRNLFTLQNDLLPNNREILGARISVMRATMTPEAVFGGGKMDASLEKLLRQMAQSMVANAESSGKLEKLFARLTNGGDFMPTKAAA